MTAQTATSILSDRIGRIEVSATMAVTAEAAQLRAQGVQLADFGAGEPHFPTPRHIKDAAIEAIEANFTRYTVCLLYTSALGGNVRGLSQLCKANGSVDVVTKDGLGRRDIASEHGFDTLSLIHI